MSGVLAGRSALVSGGGRGFGRAIAEALASAGAQVTITGRTGAELEAVASGIRSAGGAAHAITCDATDPASIERAYRAHVDAFGPTTILVNSAGRPEPIGPIGDIDAAEWWGTMTLNLRAPLQWMSLAIPDMRASGRGCIINLSALIALVTVKYNSAYAVSKLALNALSAHVAAEQADTPIAVFAVHPGEVYTKMMAGAAESPAMDKWLPEFKTMFDQLRGGSTKDASFARCAAACVTLATGRHDGLSGKFLDLNVEDLEKSVRTSLPEHT